MPAKRRTRRATGGCCACGGRPRTGVNEGVPNEGVPGSPTRSASAKVVGPEGTGLPGGVGGTPPRRPIGHRRHTSDLGSTASLLPGPAFQGCGCGGDQVRALPGILQSRGGYTYTAAAYDESARDFTRTFAGCTGGKGDILLLLAEPSGASPPAELPSEATGGSLLAQLLPAPVACTDPAARQPGNVNAEVVGVATADFRSRVMTPALLAAGGAAAAAAENDATLAFLCERVIGSCTVGAGMDALTQHECMPQMFQSKYAVLISPSAVRVLTYGFIGDPVGGDRPDTKHTPFVLRLLTENLLSDNDSGDAAAAAASGHAPLETIKSVGGLLTPQQALELAAAAALDSEESGSAAQANAGVAAALTATKPASAALEQAGQCRMVYSVCSVRQVVSSMTEHVAFEDASSGRLMTAMRTEDYSTLLEGPPCSKCKEVTSTPRPEPTGKQSKKSQLASKRRTHRRGYSI